MCYCLLPETRSSTGMKMPSSGLSKSITVGEAWGMKETFDDSDQTRTQATTGTETLCGLPMPGISSLERWTL